MSELRTMLDLQVQAFGYQSMAALLVEHGREYEVKPLTELRRGRVRECFRNAFNAAATNDRYGYVEGYAVPSNSIPIPIHHAWVVDHEDGMAIELTWRKIGLGYYGIEFDRLWAITTTMRQDYFGLIEAFAAENTHKLPDLQPREEDHHTTN